MCLRYGWQAFALWSVLLRAKVKPLHQNDYTTASAAARNGRNETPFNEDTNLRNATLPPPTPPKDTPPHAQLFSITNQQRRCSFWNLGERLTASRLSAKQHFSLLNVVLLGPEPSLESAACVAVIHTAPQGND